MHFHFENALTTTGFTAAALDIETEAAGPVSPCSSLGYLCQEVADLIENTGVGGRVRPGSAADCALINVNNLIYLFETENSCMSARILSSPVQRLCGGTVKGVQN